MRFSYGNAAGWVLVEGAGLDGPLYVRFRDAGERLQISELYIDGDGQSLDLSAVRHLPFDFIESVVNDERDLVMLGDGMTFPDLSTLASYWSTGFGKVWKQVSEGNWVVASYVAQFDDDLRSDPETGATVMQVKKQRRRSGTSTETEKEFRLQGGPTEGLTDAFLRDVAKAYRSATARGERPNVSIAEQTGYPLKTVQRWVYTARQRRIMPPGKKGRAS